MGNLSVYDWLAFLFSAGAYIPYVQSVLASKTRPTISSWISWGVMDVVILVGMIANGAMSWQLAAYCVGSLAVILVSLFKRATLGWTRFDTVCVTIVAFAILLWMTTGNPTTAIVASLVASSIGSFPFLKNVWEEPRNETPLPWLMFFAGSLCQLTAIKEWDITEAATPLVYLVVQVAAIIFISRKFLTPARDG